MKPGGYSGSSESGSAMPSILEHLRQQNELLAAEKGSLEAQSQRFHDFFDFAPDSYLVTNTDGVIQEANRAATMMLNVAHDVLVGKKLLMFVALEDRKLFTAQLMRVKAGEVQKLQDWEIQIHPYENIPVPTAVTLGVVKGYTGKPVGLRWLLRDISERKKADEMLRRSKQQLSDFVENAPVPLHWLSSEGKILWANQAEFDLLGYDRDEFLGHSFTEFHVDPNEAAEILRRLQDNETLNNFETRLRTRDGSILDVLIDSNVHWEGKRFMHARCFISNITERKRAEEQVRFLNVDLERRVKKRTEELLETNQRLEKENRERRRAEKELRDIASELRRLTNSLPDYLWSAEVDSRGQFQYRYYSPVVEKVTGRPPEYFMHGPERWASTLHPEDRPRMQKIGELARQWERTQMEDEYRIIKPDGTVRWLRDSVQISRLENGNVRLDGVVSDITERKMAEQRAAFEYSVTRIISEAQAIGDALKKILQATCENLGWDRGEFWTLSEDRSSLRCVECWQKPSKRFSTLQTLAETSSLSKGEGLAGRVWQSGSAVAIPDVSRDATFLHAREASKENVRGAFGFPISKNKVVMGVMTFFSAEARKPDSSTLRMFTTLGNQVGLFLERMRAVEALRRTEEQFKSLLEVTPQPLLIVTEQEKVILETNPAFEKFTGLSRTRVIGKNLDQFIYPADRNFALENFRLFEQEKRDSFQIRIGAGEAYHLLEIKPLASRSGGMENTLLLIITPVAATGVPKLSKSTSATGKSTRRKPPSKGRSQARSR
jgi:PAS domain S-box-containing protein